MCDVLQIARSSFYYEAQLPRCEKKETTAIVDIFRKNRNVYGTRKLKVKLLERGLVLSRRRIGWLMNEQGLVSTYTIAPHKPRQTPSNESTTANVLNREFKQTKPQRFVVSDLTYVKVQNKWNYVCILLDLFNREIIGHSAGPNKDRTEERRAGKERSSRGSPSH